MPKPKRIEIRRIGGLVVPRRRSLASALTMLTACLAVGSALAQRAEPTAAMPVPVAPQSLPAGAGEAALTMDLAIEAARQRKALEIDAALRARIGLPAVSQPAPPGREFSEPDQPRLWSLTAMGRHTWAEVYYDGRLHPLDSANLSAGSPIGPWKVVALTPESLRLMRIGAPGAAGRTRVLVVKPPPRGTTLASYRPTWPNLSASLAAASGTSGGNLTEGARRAAELPPGGQGTTTRLPATLFATP